MAEGDNWQRAAARAEIRCGRCLEAPVAVYPVKIEGGDVWVQVASPAKG